MLVRNELRRWPRALSRPNSSESWRREAGIGLCFPVSLLEAPDPEDRPLAEKGSRDQLPWGGGVIKPAGSPLGSPGPARRSQPPLSAPVPESAGGLALPFLMTPCFQEKLRTPSQLPNSCRGGSPSLHSPGLAGARGHLLTPTEWSRTHSLALRAPWSQRQPRRQPGVPPTAGPASRCQRPLSELPRSHGRPPPHSHHAGGGGAHFGGASSASRALSPADGTECQI